MTLPSPAPAPPKPAAFTKKDGQLLHAQRRARERFGVDLTPEMIERAVRAIQAGRAKFVSRQSQRVTAWDVWCGGRAMRVLYDRKRKSLATVLPRWVTPKPRKGVPHEA